MNFPHYCRLATGASFVDQLAGWLLAEYAQEPLSLARTLVLLPSRRACRSLREAFLRESNGTPMLLPRIMPIGELDNEADILALYAADLPAAMPESRRLAMLTRLIMRGENATPARAYQLAVELARLLDEATRHNVNFAKLHDLVPLDLAAHWQKTLDFLSLITREWPRILHAENKEDHASVMRTRMLELAKHWEQSPPDFPVIAAGSTGSIPATTALLATIARLPKGMVILPGLDAAMPDDAWAALEPTHPQYGLKSLLQHAGMERAQVKPLTASDDVASLRSIFAPAPLTAQWVNDDSPLVEELSHITLMQASTQTEEARMIAYKLRETLDTPGKTAALVTPDRTLARMVSAQCARYGIMIDDSAGTPLSDSASAIFLRLILEVVETGIAPGALLALLRHPFTALGFSTADAREYSRILEAQFLRGVRFESGMDALLSEIRKKNLSPGFTAFFTKLHETLRPLEMLFLQSTPRHLSAFMQAHISAAEALSATSEQPGANILWARESGIMLSGVLAEWSAESESLGEISPNDYPSLFDALLASKAVRQPFGTHPRLHILSPIEARLQHYDTIIMGEMNEGTWPAKMTPDPWMSAPMREAFGLPPHALSVGQGAHDVWMLMHAKHVILTRAQKIFGAPQEPSRWWVRFATLVGGKDKSLLERMTISRDMQATITAQDAPHDIPTISRPEATPPFSARPRRFSPSAIDMWQRDAYGFYARYILQLRALPPLDQEPDAADFGQLIHRALELFSAEHPDYLPNHSYQLLIAKGEQIFAPYASRPAVTALWWPRFEAIARHWLAREEEMRKTQYHTESEAEARWEFDIEGEQIRLTARADRVDVSKVGFRLIDYKTGTPPTKKNVEDGSAKQLPLTALALMRSGRINASPNALIYWALKTRESSKNLVEVNELDELLLRTEEELFAMIHESITELTSYSAENMADGVSDYDHFTRRAEWGAG